ncbi:bifunctional Zinc finger [Babesia duncani]|uniref:Bifunctional Zinc finger n=1 Tax=Babesia duncani TaxID=323732 RepID=A0AAD9UNZ5_9APIC|nr:bifunctional Zinc finger [Babesia duncani]
MCSSRHDYRGRGYGDGYKSDRRRFESHRDASYNDSSRWRSEGSYEDSRDHRSRHYDRHHHKYYEESESQRRYSDEKGKRTDWYNNNKSTNPNEFKDESYRKKKSPSPERENPCVILVRSLDVHVTEDVLENAVSQVAIKNGFSMPTSVTIREPGGGYVPLEYSQMNQYAYASTERVGVVEFPSSVASTKFMNCIKTRKIILGSQEYFIEFDNTSLNAPKPEPTILQPTLADIKEAEALIKMRKLANDWKCASCKFVNFSKRVACYNCTAAKPSDEELESKNLIIDSTAYSQTQIMQSLLSDVSEWLIVKNVTGEADVAKMVIEVCNIIPGAAPHLHKCIYVLDKPGQKRGFIFFQHSTKTPIEHFVNQRGNVKALVVKLSDGYHAIDTVRSLEKQVADELMKRLKMNQSPLNYEYDVETFATTLITGDGTRHNSGIKQHCVKLKISSLEQFQLAVSEKDAPSMSSNFLETWTCKSIEMADGKPETSTFVYDPNSDYLFHHGFNLYYDPSSNCYISLWGDYYYWDDALKKMRLFDYQKLNTQPEEPSAASTNAGGIAGILNAAKKVAQVSLENAQHLSRIKNNEPGQSAWFDVNSTFEANEKSDQESDMEFEENRTVTESQNVAQQEVNKSEQIPVRPLVICFTCLRSFDSTESLQTHELKSAYHKAMEALL